MELLGNILATGVGNRGEVRNKNDIMKEAYEIGHKAGSMLGTQK